MPIQVIKAIFRNIESIYNLHVDLLNLLHEKLTNWPFVYDIPAFFLKATAKFSIYATYAEGAEASEETLHFYKRKVPLNVFLAKIYNERVKKSKKTNEKLKSLYSLLILPYKHLFKLHNGYIQFMNYTPQEYPDYELLADSVAILGQLKNFIWHTADASISKRKMTILEKKIKLSNQIEATTDFLKPRVISLDPNKPIKPNSLHNLSQQTHSHSTANSLKCSAGSVFQVFAPNRKLERYGKLLVGENKRQVYLFNDICLIIEIISESTNKLENSFELQNAKIHSLSVSLENNTQTFAISFDDKSKENFIFTEKLDDIYENDEITWKELFEKLITLSNDKIFGISLSTIVENDKTTIPSIVLNIIQHLNEFIYDNELFQSVINYNSVQKLRDPSSHRKLSNSSISDVVGLLILYLEQLPDLIIPYNENDSIFMVQSTPDQKSLFNWISKQLNQMPIYTRNLLEYLMNFLFKVLKGSTLNGVTSIDLSVIFSPLILRPEKDKLSLAYCFRMARIIRIVQIMIENSSELFSQLDENENENENIRIKGQRQVKKPSSSKKKSKDILTDSNDSMDGDNKLPCCLDEFLTSDQFGKWWRDFRQKKPYFIEFITQEKILLELINQIKQIPMQEITEEEKEKSKSGSLCYGILAGDAIIKTILENDNLISIILNEFISNNNDQIITEKVNKNFCNIFEIFISKNPEKIYKYLSDFPNIDKKLISLIGSGSFCNTILSIAETCHSNEFIHNIICTWGIYSLDLYLESVDRFDSDQLSNSVRFLRFLVRSPFFLNSSIAERFLSYLYSRDFTDKLIEKAILSDKDSCVCCIPLIIEIIVQNKNKLSYKSKLDELSIKLEVLSNENEKNPEINEIQNQYDKNLKKLKKNVPYIICSILDRSDIILKHLELNSIEKDESLGFFRFGLVKLIQGILVSNYPYSNAFVSKSDLISVCLDLFFHYYRHSILHSVISYIIRYILAIGNPDLIFMLILKLNLHGRIIDVFDENSEKLEYLRGYLIIMANSIRNSNFADSMLNGNERWNNFINSVILQDEKRNKRSKEEEVSLSQKKMARANMANKEFKDHVEDKLG